LPDTFFILPHEQVNAKAGQPLVKFENEEDGER
jgi:hypothetical protein